jgi:pimeloyl-ACP methyl ester carboxylesterase
MASPREIYIANRIRRPVAYAEWAYHNDTQFRYHAYELGGGPISARYFQDKGSILWNVIRWNTHVHLGIRDGRILGLAFRGTDFPLTVQNWAKIKRWRGLCGNALTDLSFGTSSIQWDGAADLGDVRVHIGFLIAFNNLRDRLALLIDRLMECQQPSDIEVCGHSLGGALATLCALWCKTRW